MPKFKIIQDDPQKFKTNILNFWKEYLPGTPPGRFEWMENNPAGPAIWLFAIEEKTGQFAGTISLFPKDLFLDGKKIKAAILGDIMVHHNFRVFGPAQALVKTAIAYQEQGKFDFLYTVPNMKSKKLVERAGFQSNGAIYSMVCPQRLYFLLEKYVGSFFAKIIEKPLLLIMKLFSQVTYTGCSGIFKEIEWHEEEINEFNKKVSIMDTSLMTGDHSLTYLDWRYLQNPELDFKIFIYRKQEGEDIQGFFIFSLNNDRFELYDIVSLDNKIIPVMLKNIIKISKKSKSRGIYYSIFANNPILPLIKKCGFIDTKDEIEIYTYPVKVEGFKRWAFSSADRNI